MFSKEFKEYCEKMGQLTIPQVITFLKNNDAMKEPNMQTLIANYEKQQAASKLAGIKFQGKRTIYSVMTDNGRKYIDTLNPKNYEYLEKLIDDRSERIKGINDVSRRFKKTQMHLDGQMTLEEVFSD